MPRPASDRPLIRFAPLVAWVVLTFSGLFLGATPVEPLWFAVGDFMWFVVALVALVTPWSDLRPSVRFGAALTYLVGVGALRHGLGGSGAGFAPLVLIPILWLALFGTRRQLAIGFGVMLLVLVAPIIVIGGPAYPPADWQGVVLLGGVASFGGFAVRGLVDEARQQGAEATARSRELAEQMAAVNETARAHLADLDTLLSVARDLGRPASGTDGRQAICDAARELADADLALFFEARPQEAILVSTGASGDGEIPDRVTLDVRRSLTAQVFASAEATFVGEMLADPRVDRATAVRMGVRAAYWQPVIRDGQPIGILVIYWRSPQSAVSDRVRSLLELFATQAAVVVERADLMGRLENLARTDPLTSLANRRALEEALVRELATAERSGEPLSIVMLDFDHFKVYNDARGHQAGDWLLRESAAAWLRELRPSDTLARFGGEEFLAVLPGCPVEQASGIADRLRAAVPAGETVSAGVATWDRVGTMSDLIARADAALYEAKRHGRDRTSTAGPEHPEPRPDARRPGSRRRGRASNLKIVS